ncbi:outer membrane lipoprotein-sorting protein [Gracilibacillus alcaliphilus]|nr:outer membrane lipoprotein-sorting protein [Gracilibacillus alcaliphilus]
MKKSLLLFISCLIVMFLSACTQHSMEPNENNMIVNITNHTNSTFAH